MHSPFFRGGLFTVLLVEALTTLLGEPLEALPTALPGLPGFVLVSVFAEETSLSAGSETSATA